MAGQKWDWWAECDAAHSTTEATYPSLDSTNNASRLSFAESNWSVGTTAIGGESIAACGEVAGRWRIACLGGLRCSRMTNWKTMVMRALKRACWSRARRWSVVECASGLERDLFLARPRR